MRVEVSRTESFHEIIRAVAVDALPENDFTAKALLEGLPAGQDIFYRVAFEDASSSLPGEDGLRLWFAGRGGRQRCVGVGDPGASVLRIDRNLEKIRE